MYIDPWISKDNLREHLLRLKEYQQLDALIEEYVRSVLCHKIIRSPSKGRSGEQGKDIVAVENRNTGDYCSYVVKCGSLSKNLKGKYGILRQMRDALLIPIEERQYENSKRTVRVVHNGKEGSRGAIGKFVKNSKEIEKQLENGLLLRSIERWDIEDLTEMLFCDGQHLKKTEEYRMLEERQAERIEAALELDSKITTVVVGGSNVKSHHRLLLGFHDAMQKIDEKYALPEIKTRAKGRNR
jgi:hypothetical protein